MQSLPIFPHTVNSFSLALILGPLGPMRQRGEKLGRGPWVCTGPGLRLEQRILKGKRRAAMVERSGVATPQDLDSMILQVQYEARAGGLRQAERVLFIADGVVWIWRLQGVGYPLGCRTTIEGGAPS